MSTPPAEERKPHVNVYLDLHRKGAPQFLAAKVFKGIADGITSFKLRVRSGQSACYPNICVPIAGIIDYFTIEHGCSFSPAASWRSAPVLNQSGTIHPYVHDPLASPSSHLSKVWKFSSDDHYDVVHGIIGSMQRAGEMPRGVLQGLELALYEVTDNILLHSQDETNSPNAAGYVMAQYHKSEQRIAVAVFDLGQGIPSSLAKGGIRASSPSEALSAAIQRGVGDGAGAGNGLWMMKQIVSCSSGSFELTSDGARYAVRHHQNSEAAVPAISAVTPFKSGTTLVDFQLHTSRPLDIQTALNADPVNLWVDNHLIDLQIPSNQSNEALLISVAQESRGCASRYEAKAFANIAGNLMESAPGICILNFNGISMVSASFADELLVRLIDRFGIITVIQRLNFQGLTPTNAAMFDHCFQGRLFGSSPQSESH